MAIKRPVEKGTDSLARECARSAASDKRVTGGARRGGASVAVWLPERPLRR